MRIDIEGEDLIRAAGDPAAKRIIRCAAYFLLASIGDIPEETDGIVPVGTNAAPPAPPVAPAATATATGANSAVASGAVNTSTSAPAAPTVPAFASNVPPAPPAPPPPPPVDTSAGDDDSDDETEGVNTGNVPPPPPGVNTAATSAAPSSVTTAAAAPGVVSVEVDAAGMPWDERIHQKGKSKKKDNTWKLKKGVDMALVQSVTAELAARRAAAPAPTAGSLPLAAPPTGSNSVPLPPVPPNAPVAGVSAPNNVGSSVPVPPAPAVGAVGPSDALTPYRKLIDKITELTKAGKITPAKVSEICTSHGSPSLMALKGFEALIPNVDKDIDAAALGLL